MADTKLTIFVVGGADLVDAALSRADGGSKLDAGVKELVEARFPGVAITTHHEAFSGFADLRMALESGDTALIEANPQIVLLTIAHDVVELDKYGPDAADGVQRVESELSAVIGLIKEKVGARTFVTNVSTLDPSSEVFNYHGLDHEPLSLRAHRLNLMLVGVSHNEGISVIDVDRTIAELGGSIGVESALNYTKAGCEAIAAEIVTVLEDYAFFDDRPLLEQVGAKGPRS